MKVYNQLYINGQWVESTGNKTHEIVNPTTQEPCVSTPLANNDDVHRAITAARQAFPNWSQSTAAQRCDFINAAADEMQNRLQDLTTAITTTMGCPIQFCSDIQVQGAIDAFRSYAQRAFMMEQYQQEQGVTIVKEAVGVCSLINPWNYPLSQLVGKMAPALAAGCTLIAKPAEQTPLQDFIVAEVFDKIGLPAGVFNLVSGSGREIGPLLCGHNEVDMVSFTGSTAAGIKISEAAAATIKRVCLELGGKSPYIITADADLEKAVRYGVEDVMINTGQTCTALTRMLVPQTCYQQVVSIAKTIAENNVLGDPTNPSTTMGPMSSMAQQATVLAYIQKGIDEGARLVTGGTELPENLHQGAYVKPTIFADVNNTMVIAREEIFGPVLSIIPYTDIDEAVDIANDSIYGLSSAVYAKDTSAALAIARRIRAGQCYVQGSYFNTRAPFGGYKQSGNGREWGDEGLMEFVEIKSIITE